MNTNLSKDDSFMSVYTAIFKQSGGDIYHFTSTIVCMNYGFLEHTAFTKPINYDTKCHEQADDFMESLN